MMHLFARSRQFIIEWTKFFSGYHILVLCLNYLVFTCSTVLKTRIRFKPASFWMSLSDHPLASNSANNSGYLLTSSKPVGVLKQKTISKFISIPIVHWERYYNGLIQTEPMAFNALWELILIEKLIFGWN